MDKRHILNEIRRTADENGGIPLGTQRFYKETGVTKSDWYPIYWLRWSDAIKEAGFSANTFQGAYTDEFLVEKFIELIRELDRFPIEGEIRIKAKKDKNFPSHTTFGKLGSKVKRAAKIIEYCKEHSGFDDVIELCLPLCREEKSEENESQSDDESEIGFVYLLKSGRYYKIGRSNSVGRRQYELDIQLPEKVKTIHTIRTDDPAGIEAYWHRRFESKRKNGEWFELSNADVKAFQRRTFM